jgi:UDP-N-acetylmuramoyl-tripeptide--D-alanyl-D-alanine ligase
VIPLTLAEVADAAGGRVRGADPAARATGISTDSRTVRPGDLFVALKGEHVDGARYAAAAAGAGAVAVVTGAAQAGVPCVEVGDPLVALAAVAAEVRRRSGARVVGITGSSGKTLTKDLSAAVLGTTMRTVASKGSYNNEIGLPLTLAALEPETEALVVELGSRGPGHIAELCELARPHLGVVTNVGTAHYGMFGSREAIARAKGELVEALPADGAAILNADDPLVAGMAGRTAARVVRYGLAPAGGGRELPDVAAEDVVLGELGRPRFTLVTPDGRAEVALPAPGEHLVADALAAAAAGWVLGVGAGAAAAGLAAAPLSPMRMQVRELPGGAVLIDDAYNANPASTAAALRSLAAARRPGGRTVAVLGEMAELGPIADEEHDRVGRLAVRLGVDRVVGVGAAGAIVVQAARLEGIWEPADAQAVDAVDGVAAAVGQLGPADVVLVKASRAAGLERAVAALLEGGGA